MKNLFLIGCLTLGIAGCSAFDPVIDARREAGMKDPLGQSRAEAPVVCIGLAGTDETADALAQVECDKINKRAVFVRSDTFTCTLFTPTSRHYRCE